MNIVSAGVVPSISVEVWQSGHGALEVVLLDTAFEVGATSQDNTVCHLYCTCLTENVKIMNTPASQ